jgi:hypothetical protein
MMRIHSRLSTYLSHIVDMRIKPITQSLSGFHGWLAASMDQMLSLKTATEVNATAVSNSVATALAAINTAQNLVTQLGSMFVGVYESAPNRTITGTIIPAGAFYINATTSRLYWNVGTNPEGNPIWQEVLGTSSKILAGMITILGDSENSALALSLTGGDELRVRHRVQGELEIFNATTNQIMATFTSTDLRLTPDGHSVWTDGNDGPGSGMNADLLDGYHASDFVRKSECVWGRVSISDGRWIEWDYRPLFAGKWKLAQRGKGTAYEPGGGGSTFPIPFIVDNKEYITFVVSYADSNAAATNGDNVGGNINSDGTGFVLQSNDSAASVQWTATAVVNSIPLYAQPPAQPTPTSIWNGEAWVTP